MLEFDPFLDAVNQRLHVLIENGAGLMVFHKRTDVEGCEWRREVYCVRMGRYARGGVVVSRFVEERRAGPAEAVGMDGDGVANVAAIIIEHVANPEPGRDYVPSSQPRPGGSAV
jgi:hypothetical protein